VPPPKALPSSIDHLGSDLEEDLLVDPRVQGILQRAYAHPVRLAAVEDLVVEVQEPFLAGHAEPPAVLRRESAPATVFAPKS